MEKDSFLGLLVVILGLVPGILYDNFQSFFEPIFITKDNKNEYCINFKR